MQKTPSDTFPSTTGEHDKADPLQEKLSASNESEQNKSGPVDPILKEIARPAADPPANAENADDSGE